MLSNAPFSLLVPLVVLTTVNFAQAAPRLGAHPDKYRIVFDLNVKTTFQTVSTASTLTIILPGINLPAEGRSLGILNLSYQQKGNQIVLTGQVQGIVVSTLDNATEGMRLILDVPRAADSPTTLAPLPAPTSPAGLNSTCLSNKAPVTTFAAPPPPAVLTGRIGLFVAELDSLTLKPVRAVVYNADQAFPLASTYKQVVLYDVLEDIDAGKYTLNSTLTTTEAMRSILDYSRGTNTIAHLAEQAIRVSENTANDMLHLTTGLLHPQETADSLGLCNTRIMLTTKAWWTAQAGLGGHYFPQVTLLQSTQAFASAGRTDQITMAVDLVKTSFNVKAEDLLEALDGKNGYFRRRYDSRIDFNTQNVSTPREFTTLVANPFVPGKLSQSSLQFYRDTFAKGCCKPKPLPFPVNYWGAKLGTGWRLMALTGYVELPGGRKFAYSYFNHESKSSDVADMRAQVPTALKWITQAINTLK
ncbi:serine hydrolase [Deinococcus roseus]|nr:serine hydrolase [Deinococcus roseus]